MDIKKTLGIALVGLLSLGVFGGVASAHEGPVVGPDGREGRIERRMERREAGMERRGERMERRGRRFERRGERMERRGERMEHRGQRLERGRF